jgi:phage terminase small subunit
MRTKTMSTSAARVAELAAQRDAWEPPAFLTPEGAVIWRETVDSLSADHFEQGDMATLAQFCETHARLRRLVAVQARLPLRTEDVTKRQQAREIAREVGALRAACISFARLLRLAPSARDAARRKATGMPTRNPSKAAEAAKANGTQGAVDPYLP